MEIKDLYNIDYKIDTDIIERVENNSKSLKDKFDLLTPIEEYNQIKVLKAFRDNELSNTAFNWSTGYGYGDTGREVTEKIFSQVFKSEDSLVRSNIVSGTHAISIVLFSLLNYNDKIVSVTGDPYDTLQEVIGIKGDQKGNLISKGIKYEKSDLLDGKNIQYDKINYELLKDAKLIMLQRSTGYTNRKAFTIDQLKKAIDKCRQYNSKAIIFVDNCYGEFTETREPIEVGADIIAGSLIKNLGGGIALTGGYIAGRKDLIEYCANYLTAPGIGKEEGLSFGSTRNILQGLYFASHTSMESVKVALLFAKTFSDYGFEVTPKLDDKRSDIVQSIILGSREKMIDFCKGIQEACSLDASITPIPYPMPGYQDDVIMSAGGFIDGATSELSADGPTREPFTIYLQGGLNYFQGKLALMNVLQKFKNKNYID